MISEEVRIGQLDTLVRLFGKGKKAELARRLDVTDARIGMWYARKFIDVMLIAEKLPDVNANWLLRNIGEPIETGSFDGTVKKEEAKKEEQPKFFDNDCTYNTKSLVEENKRLLNEADRLRDDIKGLRDDIVKLREERDTLFGKLMEKV